MITLFVLILLLIAFWNAYVILWKTGSKSRQKKYSKIWHGIGLLLRILVWACVPVAMQRTGNWDWQTILIYSALFIVFGGVIYDFIINATRYYYEGAPELWHVDNKGWNAVFINVIAKLIALMNKIPFIDIKTEPGQAYWILRGLFVLLTILILFI